MLRKTIIICLISLVSFLFIPLSIFIDNDRSKDELQVRKGVMDLTTWNYDQNKRIKLDGEWEFYWNQLLTPEYFNRLGTENPPSTTFMEVPSQWNGKIVNGESLSAYGSATYRMVLKNVPFSGGFALKKTNIRFSSAIFVNGEKLFQDGEPSGEEATYQSGNIPQMGFFSSDQRAIEIIVQVANYDYINAGIPVSIYFGEQTAMIDDQQKSMVREFSILAILVILAFIYSICFVVVASFHHKNDYTLLLFAVICLLFSIYHGLSGERSVLLFVPGISFELIYKVKDISSMACFIVLAIFFYQLQKSMISLKLTQVVTAVLGTFLIAIPFLPIGTYTVVQSYLIIFYEILLIWLLLKSAIFYIRSSLNNRFNSLLLFMAVLTINLYSIDMILVALSLKENYWLGQLYIVGLNIIMIFLIVNRFFEAYRTIEEMKNELLQLDKVKDDFLSSTSHELKTPLNAIVNIVDTLLKGVEGPVTEKQAQNLGIVMNSGRRLTHIVNELLDYSKMKHGDIALYKSSMNIKAIVDSVIKMHTFLLGGKEITLVNLVSEDFPKVYADGNRLIQVLHNLIGNAVKYSDYGVIEVNAEVIGPMVQLQVRDTGIGIDDDMLDRLFMPFEQGDTVESNQYGGTGLGLSITKKLVELQGGTIRVDSRPGKGSVFTFTIPLAGSGSSELIVQVPATELSSKELVTARIEYPLYVQGEIDEPILVVDDDYANLQSMINLLKLERYSFVVVNSGLLALDELSKKHDFFLVILDITMTDMSGYEVLKKIRERSSLFELPVLMLTAQNRVDDMKLSLDYGANDFVGKPFEAEELMARVKSLTKLKSSVKNAKATEIAFLRSQIKPHFLYNALNSIAELCVDDPVQAEELTLQLSQYLRSSFDFKQLDSHTTLEKELELVKAYVNIEKARFGTRLQVDYEVDANPYTLLPPLILQPLVENAIRHGLMSSIKGGTVKISVVEEHGVIRFSVIDNGCGMNEFRLDQVLKPSTDKKGVGLWNISQRFKLLYDRSIMIESAEGMGTKVSFEIPVEPFNNRAGG